MGVGVGGGEGVKRVGGKQRVFIITFRRINKGRLDDAEKYSATG